MVSLLKSVNKAVIYMLIIEEVGMTNDGNVSLA